MSFFDEASREWQPWRIYIGTFLSLLSCILCGLSYAVKKLGMNRAYESHPKVALSVACLTSKTWLFGQLLIIIGEFCHYLAFSFAPAIVVSTIQILTVLVSAVASSKLLGEKINRFGKVAFALSLSGCWVIVFNAPSEPTVNKIDNLLTMLTDPEFLSFVVVVVVATFLMMTVLVPKWGSKNSVAYTFESALLGSILIVGIKGLMVGFTDTFNHWLPWFSLATIIVCLSVQIDYINRALSMYNTLVVTTQYYVFYSAFVILASSLLFKVWKKSTLEMALANFCGLMSIVLGVLIFTIFQEEDATFDFSKLFGGPEMKVNIA